MGGLSAGSSQARTVPLSVNMVDVVKADPADDLAWLALADQFEESGQPGPAELHRLSLALRRPSAEPQGPTEARLRLVLASGVRPVVPMEVVRLGTGVEMKLALVPPGSFLMGSSEREPGRAADEGPVHRVTLSAGFYLGIHPVTQAQWWRMMGKIPNCFRGDDRPVDNVIWDECQVFCSKLTTAQADASAYPRRRNGNSPAGQAPRRPSTSGTRSRSSRQTTTVAQSTAGGGREPIAGTPCAWGRSCLTPLGCSTCTATSTSGASTPTRTTPIGSARKTIPAATAVREPSESFAAEPGATTRRAAGRRVGRAHVGGGPTAFGSSWRWSETSVFSVQ